MLQDGDATRAEMRGSSAKAKPRKEKRGRSPVKNQDKKRERSRAPRRRSHSEEVVDRLVEAAKDEEEKPEKKSKKAKVKKEKESEGEAPGQGWPREPSEEQKKRSDKLRRPSKPK
eukprot:11678710-Karenia_brevis.AAC.1